MKKSRFTETQIVTVLKQAYTGVPVKDICRRVFLLEMQLRNMPSGCSSFGRKISTITAIRMCVVLDDAGDR
jgi:hypothetical protein